MNPPTTTTPGTDAPPAAWDLGSWINEVRDWLGRARATGGSEADAPDLRWPAGERLGKQLGLGLADRFTLALLAAQELDPACGREIEALGDGVSGRPWLHAGLLRWLLPGVVPVDLLAPSAPLRHWRLVETGPGPGPGATRAVLPLRLDERVLDALLGRGEALDARLAPYLRREPPSVPLTPSQAAVAEQIVGLWASAPGFLEFPVIELRGSDAAAARAVAWQAARRAGFEVLELVVPALPGDHGERHELARLWQREALLRRAVLFLDATGAVAVGDATGYGGTARHLPEAVRHWLSLSAGGLVVAGSPRVAPLESALPLEVPGPTFAEKRDLIEAFTEVHRRDANSFASRVAAQFELGAGPCSRRVARRWPAAARPARRASSRRCGGHAGPRPGPGSAGSCNASSPGLVGTTWCCPRRSSHCCARRPDRSGTGPGSTRNGDSPTRARAG